MRKPTSSVSFTAFSVTKAVIAFKLQEKVYHIYAKFAIVFFKIFIKKFKKLKTTHLNAHFRKILFVLLQNAGIFYNVNVNSLAKIPFL